MLTESSKKVANEYICLTCDYTTSRKNNFDKHLTTRKHKSLTNVNTPPQQKVANDYICLECDYVTSHKKSYIKHMSTSKHTKLTSVNKKVATEMFICDICDKSYMSRVGLWKHQKTCTQNQNDTDNDTIDPHNFMNVIIEVVKSNTEFQKQMFEFVKTQSISNTITNTNTNCMNHSNNKTFNLQFFLNETCKDAMNITEFIESLQLDISDLENIGSLGYVDGISKIIIKHLKALDETMRPIHCTDKKRVTFYVKDDDKWEKDDDNKTRIRKAINDVANENTMLLPLWKAKHPDYLDSSSIYSDKYNNMVIEVLGGDNSNDVNENKIIKKLAKEVMIQKQ